ncbi:MAG: FAD-dependent oxidoreductase [Actinomycetota bacterium]
MGQVTYDVAVVGAGIMGASTASHLAAAGRSVVVLERFEVGHRRGSSHGSSRIFRLSYPDAAYVDMAQESLSLWRAFEEQEGEQLVTTTGGLDLGVALDRHASALARCGVVHEVATPDEAARRWPFLQLGAAERVLFQPAAGFVAAAAAWSAFARAAARAGADLRERMPVSGLAPRSGGVELATPAGSVRARAAVVTAGSWARDLLAPVGLELPTTTTRETVAYFGRAGPALPSIVDWEDPAVYALEAPGLGGGVKVGLHHAGPVTDPDASGAPDPVVVDRLASWVSHRLPGVDPHPVGAETCLYTNAPEERFILERRGSIVVGSACSGHGFKFAPLIGARVAALAHEALEANA